MNAADRQQADALDAVARAMAEWAVDLQWQRDPCIARRYGQQGRDLWKCGLRVLLQHLAEAIAADRPQLFLHHAAWSFSGFVARDVNESDLVSAIECLREVLSEELPKEPAARCVKLIDAAIESLMQHEHNCRSTICGTNACLARMYLLHLLQRDQSAAGDLIFEAQREGKSVPELYESVIAPALTEVGRMWHLQEASVADEHYCTAATQMIMAQIRARSPRRRHNGRRVLATAVGGDLHDIGIRMVADIFEMDGWKAEFLGANMPSEEVVHSLADEDGAPRFDLLAVSAGTALSVRPVNDLIAAVRRHPSCGTTPVFVGGGPFRVVDDLWHVVGADGCAADASSAVEVGLELVERSGLAHA